eukprot:m.150652 g.150652  ORF g.150652 m.150652 type:complete len:372 (-) comp17387_c0_seq7:461-1576(-)
MRTRLALPWSHFRVLAAMVIEGMASAHPWFFLHHRLRCWLRPDGRHWSLSRLTGAVVSFRVLDVSSLASVRTFVDEWRSTEQPLHILINNAGINSPRGARSSDGGRPKHSPGCLLLGVDLISYCDELTPRPHPLLPGFDLIFATNFVGHFALTLLLLPVLVRSGTPDNPARIVNLASVMHHWGTTDWIRLLYSPDSTTSTYAASKLAMIYFSDELQRRLAARGVETVAVCSVNPGAVNSDIWRHLPAAVKCLADVVFRLIFLTAEQGSRCSVVAALAPLPVPDGGVGPAADGSTMACGGQGKATPVTPYLVPYRVVSTLSWLRVPLECLGPFYGPVVCEPSGLARQHAPAKQLFETCLRLCALKDPEKLFT